MSNPAAPANDRPKSIHILQARLAFAINNHHYNPRTRLRFSQRIVDTDITCDSEFVEAILKVSPAHDTYGRYADEGAFRPRFMVDRTTSRPMTLSAYIRFLRRLAYIYARPETPDSTKFHIDYAAAHLREMLRRRIPALFRSLDPTPHLNLELPSRPIQTFEVGVGCLAFTTPHRTFIDALRVGHPTVFTNSNELHDPIIKGTLQYTANPVELFDSFLLLRRNPASISALVYPHHYLSRSQKEPGMVTYHRTLDNFLTDRQTRTTIGKYLTEFLHAFYSPNEIQRYATTINHDLVPAALHITNDENEMVRVYRQGPQSCMKHDASFFYGGYHPVRVYASPDLALAWCTDTANPDRITGRAVVNTRDRTYGRIYGDENRLSSLMRQSGYTYDSNWLHFTRILKVCADNGNLHGPYIDQECSIHELLDRPGDQDSVNENYLVIQGTSAIGRYGLTKANLGECIGTGRNADRVNGLLTDSGRRDSDNEDQWTCDSCEEPTTSNATTVYAIRHYTTDNANNPSPVRTAMQWCEPCTESTTSAIIGNPMVLGHRRIPDGDAEFIENDDRYVASRLVDYLADHPQTAIPYVRIDGLVYDHTRPAEVFLNGDAFQRPILYCENTRAWFIARKFAQIFDPARPDELLYVNLHGRESKEELEGIAFKPLHGEETAHFPITPHRSRFLDANGSITEEAIFAETNLFAPVEVHVNLRPAASLEAQQTDAIAIERIVASWPVHTVSINGVPVTVTPEAPPTTQDAAA